MGSEKTQPTRIDADEYARFKQYVQDVHGTTRGHLKTEIENALREYRADDGAPEQLTRIEQDLATVKALVAEGEGDGGATVPDGDVHTHTRNTDETGAGKPAANAPRREKVDYIVASILNSYGEQIMVGDVRSEVQSEYNFGDRTLDEIVPMVVDALDDHDRTMRHPNNQDIIGLSEEQVEMFQRVAEDGVTGDGDE